ncbi:Hypothetical predicted protein, partial [Paramuricea clavata]
MRGLAWEIEQKAEELKVELAEMRLRKRASHVVEKENNESDVNEAELNLSSGEINEVNGNNSGEVKLNNSERNSQVLSHEIVEDGELNTNCDRAHEGTVNGKQLFVSKNVVNLSSRELTHDEIELLPKGSNFCPTPKSIDKF